MFIQFMIVKKHNDSEYFEYLRRQIKAPIVPIIPLKNKLLDKKGVSKSKNKKVRMK